MSVIERESKRQERQIRVERARVAAVELKGAMLDLRRDGYGDVSDDEVAALDEVSACIAAVSTLIERIAWFQVQILRNEIADLRWDRRS
jgi:hypothetical protein